MEVHTNELLQHPLRECGSQIGESNSESAIFSRYHLLVKAKVGFFQRLNTQRERLRLHAPSNKHLRKMITPLYAVDKDFNLKISEASREPLMKSCVGAIETT